MRTDSNHEFAIEAVNLAKHYRIYKSRWLRLRAALTKDENHCRTLIALEGINFSLRAGSTLGIVGPNGSGKTTLLQLLAGLIKPSSGHVAINGRVATLLELASGFHPDLTGRENILIGSGLSEPSRQSSQERLKEIVDFSEIGEFLDYPVRHYSTGMLMRLAFSISISLRPAIFLIDEIFSVGDMAFQHKCSRKFRELQQNGTTIVLATHDLAALKSLCDSAILLNRGKQVMLDSPVNVANYYLSLVAGGRDSSAKESAQEVPQPVSVSLDHCHRHGTGEARIEEISISNRSGIRLSEVPFGEKVSFRFTIRYCESIHFSILGFYIRDRYGNDVLGTNTFEEGKTLGPRSAGDRLIVEFSLEIRLKPGSYSLNPGLAADRNDPRYFDWIDNALCFEVLPPEDGRIVYGMLQLPVSVQVSLEDS